MRAKPNHGRQSRGGVGGRWDPRLGAALPEVTLPRSVGRLQLYTYELGTVRKPPECPGADQRLSPRSSSQATAVISRTIGGLGMSLMFLIPFPSFGSRPGTNGVGIGFTTYHWRWSFPVRRIPRMTTEWSQIVRGTSCLYEDVRGHLVLNFVVCKRVGSLAALP